MTDREKVVRALDCLSRNAQNVPCNGCAYFRPFTDDQDTGWCDRTSAMNDALALLREQEPVKPADYDAWSGKKCGVCGTILSSCMREEATMRRGIGKDYVYNRVRYCPWCGRGIKWND